ncbi:MAG TPA: type 4a pilus biogenesis protein PilO [Gemmatimonadaceae bacterium]|jgi:type IV pilus assembly protein PilO
MALLPQNQRDQKLLVVAMLAIGLAAVYQQLVWTPKNLELTRLEVRLDTLDSLNRLTKLEVAKGTSANMKAEAASFSRELDELRHLVPTQNEVPALLESVSTAARSAGIDLSDVQPDGVVNGDQFDTYKYKLGVIGSYHQVGEFLSNVGSLSRIVAPINVSLVPTTNRTTEHKPKKDEQLLDARFQIQTYVVHVSTKPASGKAGQ